MLNQCTLHVGMEIIALLLPYPYHNTQETLLWTEKQWKLMSCFAI